MRLASALRRFANAAVRVTAGRCLAALWLALLALGVAWAGQQWRYQRAFAAGDFAAATQAWPEAAEGWRAWAQRLLPRNPVASERAARRATALNSADWRNWQALAQIQVERGDYAGARDSMAQMAVRSRSFEAAWSYANLLLLSGDAGGFWRNAARALALAPAERLQAALASSELAAAGDLRQVSAEVAAARAAIPNCSQSRALETGYFAFLLERDARVALDRAWPRLARDACISAQPPAAMELAGRYITSLLARGSGPKAQQVWTQGVATHIFPLRWGPSADDRVVDGDFRQLGSSGAAAGDRGPLHWTVCLDCGPYVFRAAGGGLELEFHGQDTGPLNLAREWLLLAPGSAYTLRLATRSVDANASGVFAQVVTDRGAVLARLAAPLSHDGQVVATGFLVPAETASYRLELGYTRPAGQLPLTGTVVLRDISVRPLSRPLAAANAEGSL